MNLLFTKGTWSFDEDLQIVTIGHGEAAIAMVPSPADACNFDPETDAEYNAAIEEGVANGRLIAAAPELFEALECAQDATTAGSSVPEVSDAMYAKWEPRMAPYIAEWKERKPGIDKECLLRLLAVRLRNEVLAKVLGLAP